MSLAAQFAYPSGALGHVVGWLMANSNRALTRWAVGVLQPSPGDDILELGCGPGVGLEELARAARTGTITGVDPSPVMIAQARRRNRELIASGRVRLIESGAERLSLAEAGFDHALTINSLPFWADTARGLQEVHRVLKPQGRFVTALQPRWVRRQHDVEALAVSTQDQLRAAHFTVIKCELHSMQPIGAFAVIAQRP